MARDTLVHESEPLVHVDGAFVEVVSVQPQAFQPQPPETEIDEGLQGVRAEAPAGLRRVADRDADPGIPVRQVRGEQPDRSDRPLVVEPADHERPGGLAVVLEHVLEPVLLEREAHRGARPEVPHRGLVVEPADEHRNV